MTVSVTFCVNLVYEVDSCIGEGELNNDFGSYRADLLAEEPLEGALIIKVPGQVERRIRDELWSLVVSLCFEAIPELLTGNAFNYSYFAHEGSVEVIPFEKSLHISGDYVESIIIPRGELPIALFDCGQRFIELLSRLGDDSPHETVRKYLEERAEVAKRALDTL